MAWITLLVGNDEQVSNYSQSGCIIIIVHGSVLIIYKIYDS
jgi:hypothetical protein